MDKLAPLIKDLSLNELMVLNRMVVNQIHMIEKASALYSLSQLNIGDRVSWYGNDGIERTGIIIRLNQKTASVKADDEGYWKISPFFLRKVTER
jgi:hypothetical protein